MYLRRNWLFNRNEQFLELACNARLRQGYPALSRHFGQVLFLNPIFRALENKGWATEIEYQMRSLCMCVQAKAFTLMMA